MAFLSLINIILFLNLCLIWHNAINVFSKAIPMNHSYFACVIVMINWLYTEVDTLTFKVNWVILMVWLSEWVMACGVQDPGSKVKPLPHAALAVLWCWITPSYPIVVFLGNTSGYCLSGHVLKALCWGTETKGQEGLSRPWQNKVNSESFQSIEVCSTDVLVKTLF